MFHHAVQEIRTWLVQLRPEAWDDQHIIPVIPMSVFSVDAWLASIREMKTPDGIPVWVQYIGRRGVTTTVYSGYDPNGGAAFAGAAYAGCQPVFDRVVEEKREGDMRTRYARFRLTAPCVMLQYRVVGETIRAGVTLCATERQRWSASSLLERLVVRAGLRAQRGDIIPTCPVCHMPPSRRR